MLVPWCHVIMHASAVKRQFSSIIGTVMPIYRDGAVMPVHSKNAVFTFNLHPNLILTALAEILF